MEIPDELKELLELIKNSIEFNKLEVVEEVIEID